MIDNISACEEAGGEWKKVGIAPNEMCVLRTKDGGRQCTDNSECEAGCRAPENAKAGERAVGICIYDNSKVGCSSWLQKGIVSPMLCVD